MSNHPSRLPIPEKVTFSEVLRKGWSKPRLQAKFETEMGTIVVVPDKKSALKPSDGELWVVEICRILVQKPGFWLVSVECVEQVLLATLGQAFNLCEEKAKRQEDWRKKEKKRKKRTGQFWTKERQERFENREVHSKGPSRLLHLERHHKTAPPKRGEVVSGLQKSGNKAGRKSG